MSEQKQWGFYTELKGKDQYTLYFELDTCETCGGEVQSADGTPWVVTPKGQFASRDQLHKMFRVPKNVQLKFCETQPAEQYYNEDTDLCICDNCPN